MTNYILFWAVGGRSDPREQELAQRAKELLKLYRIPDGDGAEFVLLDRIDPAGLDAPGNLAKVEEILGRISLQVGCCREWRLLFFLMGDLDLLSGTGEAGLADLLAYMMHYEDPDQAGKRALEQCYLTCERPEHIWLITLQNEPEDGLPHLVAAGRPDEQCYSMYPPNCRFLRFPLDFQRQSRFSRAMLELHCGVRSLARNILPAELLKGNRTYHLKVELDEGELSRETEQYGQWLDRVEQGLRQLEQRPGTGVLHLDSVPRLDSIFPQNDQELIRRRLNIGRDEPENRLKRLEAEADKILQEDVQYEKDMVWDILQRLAQWESQQGPGVMSDYKEEQWRQEMEDREQEMLRPQVKKRGLGEWLFQIVLRTGDYLFNFQGKFEDLFAPLSYEAEREQATFRTEEREYRYAAGVARKMAVGWGKRLARPAASILSCFLLVMVALDQTGAGNMGGLILADVLLSLPVIVVVYVAYFLCYSAREGRAFRALKKRQRERVLNSRRYFNHMIAYLRSSRVLDCHRRRAKAAAAKRTLLLRQKEELAYYRGIYGQLKICCIGIPSTGETAQRQGDILKMLRNSQSGQLFCMPGQLPQLEVNGNWITGGFSFVKSIQLIWQLPWLAQRTPAPRDGETGEQEQPERSE